MPCMKEINGYYVADSASITKDVTIGEASSVWYGAVIRGDEAPITIGKNTNVQDLVVIHPEPPIPVVIGDNNTIGHSAIVHCKSIGNNCVIGMGSILLAGSEIGDECLIAAGSVVSPNKKIPSRSVVMGIPGKVVREVTDEELAHFKENVEEYIGLAKQHLV